LVALVAHPTTRREQRSRIAARYSHPSSVQTVYIILFIFYSNSTGNNANAGTSAAKALLTLEKAL
jgi:hypothetical protein